MFLDEYLAEIQGLCKEHEVITDSRKIVDNRNRIIHGYDSVTADIL